MPAASNQDTTALAVDASNFSWRHAGRKAWALKDLDLRVEPGERVLLTGASGSGKSTLGAAIAGVLDLDAGEAGGAIVASPAALVQQDPDAQIVMQSVGDEVAFGLENTGVPREQIWPRVCQALEMVGLDLPLNTATQTLSGGQKQRLALACALAMRPKLLVLDEPTANLDPAGAADLRRAVDAICKETGAALVVIEHDLTNWADLVDRVVVLSDGAVIVDAPVAEVFPNSGRNGAPQDAAGATRRAALEQRLLKQGLWVPGAPPPLRLWPRATPEDAANQVAQPQDALAAGHPDTASLQAVALSAGYGTHAVLRDVDLALQPGTITAIQGPNGAGKSTLALTLAGLLQPISGEVRIHPAPDGTERAQKPPHLWKSVDLLGRVAMVFQEPAHQFLRSTVAEELRFGLHLAHPDRDPTPEVERYLEALNLLHLRDAHPLSLSGGEQRRLSVATALICAPRVLILDEPTFGQDRNTWAALVGLLGQARDAGTAIVAVTHDAQFVDAVGARAVEVGEVGAPDTSTKAGKQGEQAETPLQSLNPVAALFALAVLTIPLVLTIDPVSAAIALGLELLTLALLRPASRRTMRLTWPLLAVTPLAMLSMLLYARPAGRVFWSLGPAVISENSLTLALAIGLRILAVGLPAVLILANVNATRLADALTQIVRLPPRLVFSALAGMRTAAIMAADWQALARARRSRGEKTTGAAALARSSVSLLVFAIRRAGTLSTTMQARGLESGVQRTNARKSTLSSRDLWAVLICAGIAATALASAVWVGAFRWFGI